MYSFLDSEFNRSDSIHSLRWKNIDCDFSHWYFLIFNNLPRNLDEISSLFEILGSIDLSTGAITLPFPEATCEVNRSLNCIPPSLKLIFEFLFNIFFFFWKEIMRFNSTDKYSSNQLYVGKRNYRLLLYLRRLFYPRWSQWSCASFLLDHSNYFAPLFKNKLFSISSLLWEIYIILSKKSSS